MDAREIRRRIGIDDVLEWYGMEPHDGPWNGWHSLKCPFHDDHVESASIDRGQDLFVCHACDVKGDVIGVVKTAQGIGYREACEWIEHNLISSTSEDSTQESSIGWE